MKLLITGASGKVGSALISECRRSRPDIRMRALCHRRSLEPDAQLEVVRGSISERSDVRAAAAGVTHVVHLATCKETPQDVMDVTVKGLFWLLEECRQSSSFEQFILIGGDAAVGHFFYPAEVPITEAYPHRAYPGCYALSKVLEEVMLEQFYIQYGLPGCCLRAPWIMEKDDFRFSLSFGDDVFGGPRWRDLVGAQAADEYLEAGCVPVMLDPHGNPVKRNFVHVDDLVAAILAALDHPTAAHQKLFNVCMDEPVDYRAVGEYLQRTRGLTPVEIATPYHSTWLDNSKAKLALGWRPSVGTAELIERSYGYQRDPGEPRKVWYPG